MEPPQIRQMYRAYSDRSDRYQRQYLTLFFIELALAIVIATLALVVTFGLQPMWRQAAFGIVASAFLLGILDRSYSSKAKVEQKWFICRAVAESMKTITWRYCTRADEVPGTEDAADSAFLRSLRELEAEAQNRAAMKIESVANALDIPQDLRRMRSQPWEQRRDVYVAYRIDDQVSWYMRRARRNSRYARLFSATVVTTQIIGVLLALYFLVIGFDVTPFVALVVTVVTCLLAWKQTRQYAELVEPYSIAATELRGFRERVSRARDESEFSSYVVQSELAISREHSTWLARRGVAVKSRTA